MFSQLVHHTASILRARPFTPHIPSSLGALQIPLIRRNNSWSGQPQAANWSHLNDIYSRGAINMNTEERPSSPDERWAVQSRSRMTTLTAPKGPYAGKAVVSFKPHDFLIYQSREECRGERWKRCRRTEQVTIHPTEKQGCVRTQADCTTRKERL